MEDDQKESLKLVLAVAGGSIILLAFKLLLP